MLYPLNDPDSFKRENLENWRANTEFWAKSQMRHIADVRGAMLKALNALATRSAVSPIVIVDMGCGEGWVFRVLRECRFEFRYVGLDFNPDFIDNLKKSTANDPRARFECIDLEQELPKDLVATADIVVNCFNFFEIPRLEEAFDNAVRLLRPRGWLVILTIDPMTQLISISRNYQELLESLADYETARTHMTYDKDIDIGDTPSGRIYKGILYSVETYITLAQKHHLCLEQYCELVKTRRFPPQIYEFFVFRHRS